MCIDIKVRQILNELHARVESGNDGVICGDRSRALEDLDSLLSTPSNKGIKDLLAPTSNLQELSIENGWGQEFIQLAKELEDLLGIY